MEREKKIQTKELQVKGNIMTWSDMMIQLSNVSCISTHPLAAIPFPVLSILALVAGVILLSTSAFAGIILIVLGVCWIYLWVDKNKTQKDSKNLNILMNSGNNFSFIVHDPEFLNEIVMVLEQVLMNGGVGNSNITFNIKDNVIDGNAQLLNDLNIRG